MKRRLLIAAASITAGLLWWFPALNWLDKPKTPYLGFLLIALAIVGLYLHNKVFWRYHEMVLVIRRECILGMAAQEDVLFAQNQRFRYAWRLIEFALSLVVGILLVAAWRWPQILFNQNYGKIVVTYFFGSSAITAMLSKRDDYVLDRMEALDSTAEGTHLTPFHPKDQHG